MIIEITEEEMQFLERLLIKEKLFCKINAFHPGNDHCKNLKIVDDLLEKLKEIHDE